MTTRRTIESRILQEVRVNGDGADEPCIVRDAARALVRAVVLRAPARDIRGRVVGVREELQGAVEEAVEWQVDAARAVDVGLAVCGGFRRLGSQEGGIVGETVRSFASRWNVLESRGLCERCCASKEGRQEDGGGLGEMHL